MNKMIRSTAAASAIAAALTMASTVSAVGYNPDRDLGSPGDANSVERVVTITPETKWLNVDYGEDVKIVDAATGRSFVWDFNTPNLTVDLANIAPAGMLNEHIIAYVDHPSEDD